MEIMEIIYCIIISVFVHSTEANSTDNVYDVIAPFEDDFTPETYAFFNVSKKYKKFDLTELESLSRRWGLLWYSWFADKQYYGGELAQRLCYFFTMTYLGAMPELRRYFHTRFLYVNTMEYELGYMAYDIIYRYQMMVEIFQIVHTKYYMEPWRFKTQIAYIFYMYRNLLEYGMTVMHLCNMMHEIVKKYKKHRLGHWDDYPNSAEVAKTKSNSTKESKQSLDDYLKRREEEYKRRQRQRRKERKQLNIDGDFRHTTPQRRPKKSFWPLHYGWSIEYW